MSKSYVVLSGGVVQSIKSNADIEQVAVIDLDDLNEEDPQIYLFKDVIEESKKHYAEMLEDQSLQEIL